jgi:hypothetical protein
MGVDASDLSPVGEYSYNFGSLRIPNYTLAFGSTEKFKVNPLKIRVTPNSQSKHYGHPDPVLTYSIAKVDAAGPNVLPGMLLGSLSRVAGEELGSYPITYDNMQALDSNYLIDFDFDSVLHITLAPTPEMLALKLQVRFNGGQDTLTLSPAFAPDQLSYNSEMMCVAGDLTLSITPSVQATASFAVNSESLTAVDNAISWTPRSGPTDIRITLQGDTYNTKTSTYVVRLERPFDLYRIAGLPGSHNMLSVRPKDIEAIGQTMNTYQWYYTPNGATQGIKIDGATNQYLNLNKLPVDVQTAQAAGNVSYQMTMSFDGSSATEHHTCTEMESRWELSAQLVAYPVPAHQTVSVRNVQWEDAKTIEIYDLNGVLLRKYNATTNNQTLNIEGLPSGAYLLKSGKQVTRLVIK